MMIPRANDTVNKPIVTNPMISLSSLYLKIDIFPVASRVPASNSPEFRDANTLTQDGIEFKCHNNPIPSSNIY